MSQTTVRHELIQIADAVAREKGIEKEEVLNAMEQAIQKAGRSKYGSEYDIRAHIDPKSGEISLKRCREVVEEVTNSLTEISLKDAQAYKADIKVGELVEEELPPIDFGRVSAQSAKQVIMQRVREAERLSQYKEFKDRVGEIINGTVKRVEFGNVTVELGRAEAVMPKEEGIPREIFKPGDRLRAYIYDVRQEQRGAQIFISRAHPQFMAKLFAQEVPEIYDGIIEIVAVSRDPGSRAKIAVISKDPNIDPVGACVGVRGSRVQAVVNELQGEKVDIVLWSPDLATFVVNSLVPAEVSKVVLDEETRRIEVVVPDDQLSLAIGRRGQNVKLATNLTGWGISILTETDEMEKRSEEARLQSQLFINALDVDEVIAQLLIVEGFTTLEEVAYVPVEELLTIQGFDEELARELQSRARQYLENEEQEVSQKIKELKIENDLKDFEKITPRMLIKLGSSGIKSLDDLADLSSEELQEYLADFNIDEKKANEIIMAARAHWFEEETLSSE